MADLSASATGRFGGLEQQHVDHPAADERLARSMPGLGGGGARAGAGRREQKKKKKKKKATGAAAKSNAQKPVWAREGRHSRFSVQGGIHHPSSIPGATVDAHNHVAQQSRALAEAKRRAGRDRAGKKVAAADAEKVAAEKEQEDQRIGRERERLVAAQRGRESARLARERKLQQERLQEVGREVGVGGGGGGGGGSGQPARGDGLGRVNGHRSPSSFGVGHDTFTLDDPRSAAAAASRLPVGTAAEAANVAAASAAHPTSPGAVKYMRLQKRASQQASLAQLGGALDEAQAAARQSELVRQQTEQHCAELAAELGSVAARAEKGDAAFMMHLSRLKRLQLRLEGGAGVAELDAAARAAARGRGGADSPSRFHDVGGEAAAAARMLQVELAEVLQGGQGGHGSHGGQAGGQADGGHAAFTQRGMGQLEVGERICARVRAMVTRQVEQSATDKGSVAQAKERLRRRDAHEAGLLAQVRAHARCLLPATSRSPRLRIFLAC
jgi:hypothetical protein